MVELIDDVKNLFRECLRAQPRHEAAADTQMHGGALVNCDQRIGCLLHAVMCEGVVCLQAKDQPRAHGRPELRFDPTIWPRLAA